VQDGKDDKSSEHPTVTSVFALASAKASTAEENCRRHHERRDSEGDKWWVREERNESAPAKNSQTELQHKGSQRYKQNPHLTDSS